MTAFIFDLDGTLADSIPNILDVAKRSFAQLGKTVSEDTIIEYVGIPLIQTGEDLLGPGRGREYADAYMETYAKTVFDLQASPAWTECCPIWKQQAPPWGYVPPNAANPPMKAWRR